jgi:hypothetical protein
MVAAILELTVIGFRFNALLLYASYDTSGCFVGQFLEPFPIGRSYHGFLLAMAALRAASVAL